MQCRYKSEIPIFFNPADSEVWDLQDFKSIFQTKNNMIKTLVKRIF